MIDSYKRFNVLYSFIILALIILMIRLSYLQVIVPDQLISAGDLRSLRIKSIPAARGNITDRMGRLLAISAPVQTVWIDPKRIDQCGGILHDIKNWENLSKALSVSLDTLSELIHDHSTARFLYLARKVNPGVSKHISQLSLPEGVYLKQELKRYYPSGCTTAHIVGMTNIDHQGIEGIEKSFDTWLTGTPSVRSIRQSRNGRIIEDVNVIRGQTAQDLMLSIDERLQSLAYRELKKAIELHKAESGSVVLIDIDTGEVLAMTNVPSYNPNDNLSTINKNYIRNRSITDSFEPGSTVKPMVIMAALKHKIIQKDTVLNTLPYMVNGFQVKDVISYSRLTIREILQKSSNVGVSKLALSIPVSELIEVYENFGMGRLTNIELVGESRGKYPYHRKWSDVERVVFSYGYGLMLTPLQLAKVYATIGGMGVDRPISIVRVSSSSIPPGNQVFPKSLVRTVLDMMESVSMPGGVGSQASIKGYRVAVKTGTVKKVDITGQYVNRYIAYTAGVAPASNPKLALVVIVNDPKGNHYYGGVVSAPVFSVVMKGALKMMNIAPDATY